MNRLSWVDLWKQRHGTAKVKYMGKVEQSKLRDIEGGGFDFGKAAARDWPASELQAVSQFLLSPAVFVPQFADLPSHQI